MKANSGSCLKKILIGLGVLVLGVALLGGYVYYTIKKSFVFDSESVISRFQEAVPGAQIPEGYDGAMAFDYRGTGQKQETLQAVVCRTKKNPDPEGWPERVESKPTMKFVAYNYPTDLNLTPDLWQMKYNMEVRNSREDIERETVTMAVGGKDTELQKIHSKDDDGDEYTEYRLDIPQQGRHTILLISAPVGDFQPVLLEKFLQNLEPVSSASKPTE